MSIKTNYLLTVSLSILFLNQLQAQEAANDSTKQAFYYEQGINCTQFVKQYLSFNDNFITNMPYLLTGNIGFKKIGLRYGTNYQVSNSKNKTSGSSSTNTSPGSISPPSLDQQNSVVIDNRIGFYYRKYYFKRLSVNIGLDFLLSNSVIRVKTESTQVNSSGSTLSKSDLKTISNSMGYGPCLAVNFKVWKSISLGTEAALYYFSGSSTQEASSYSAFTPSTPFGTYTFVNQEESGKTTFGGTEIRIPLTLFVYFKF
jgi:hypothetical protein